MQRRRALRLLLSGTGLSILLACAPAQVIDQSFMAELGTSGFLGRIWGDGLPPAR